jgi:hypothetical protein
VESNPFSIQKDSGNVGSTLPNCEWFISADKIFGDDVEGLKDFTRFFKMEFCISRFSLFDGKKSTDSAVLAQDVKIHLPSGKHCAMIQSRLAKGTEISKITIMKTTSLTGKILTLEEKTFSKCVIQSFSYVGEVVSFSFRYSSYSDSYTDYNEDTSKKGTAASQIDLIKWEIKDS